MQQTRLFMAAFIALTLAFSGLAWWVWATSVTMHWTIPVLCTLAPLGLGLAAFYIPRLRAHRGAQAFEADLRAQQREAHSAEIDEMRSDFERAAAALKASLAGDRIDGRDAFVVLPWYMIVGPPGCGKTTALRQSGLRFHHVEGTGDKPAVKGYGGTRNLDWFLTNDAILIDTAGRWSTGESGPDADEWKAFLGLLRKHRGRQPLNGVILAMSLAENVEPGDTASVEDAPSILGLGDRDIVAVAERMRTRLNQVAVELGVRLPVYVVFTKCDLLRGFIDMFGDMSAAQRRQVWGFNARVGEIGDAPAVFFERCFDELCRQLERRALWRMREESRPEVLERIFAFPGQLRALRGKLRLYMDELLSHGRFRGEAALLRGVYFTCGTQQGAPAQAMLDELAAELGIEEPMLAGEPRDESYFVHDMLKEVVFRDKDLATASDAQLLRRKRVRRSTTAVMSALAALMLAWSGVSYLSNRTLLAHTRSVLSESSTNAASLWPLHQELQRYQAGGPLLATGFYQGDRILGPLRDLFAKRLQRSILRELYADNTALLKQAVSALEQMRAMGGQAHLDAKSRQLKDAKKQQLTEALKLHLLLGRREQTSDSRCPIPSVNTEQEQSFLIPRLLSLWQQRSPAEGSSADERRAMLTTYLSLLSPKVGVTQDALAFRTEPTYVPMARAELGADDPVERELNAIVARYASAPLAVAQIADLTVFKSRLSSIRGAFTHDAWRQVERAVQDGRLWDASGGADCWVLGGVPKTAEQRSSELGARLRARYLEAYFHEWDDLIEGLATRSPDSLADAQTLLIALPDRLRVLLMRVQEQASRPVVAAPAGAADALRQGLADKATAAATDTAVASVIEAALAAPNAGPVEQLRGFYGFSSAGEGNASSGLDSYRQEVQVVLAALTAAEGDPTRMPDLRAAVDNAIVKVRVLLGGYTTFAAPLEKLLLPPLDALAALVVDNETRAEQARLQDAWCAEFYGPFREQLAGRFPFKRDYDTRVTAADLALGSTADVKAIEALFRPGQGALWTFVDEQLDAYVVRAGSRFHFGARDGRNGARLLRAQLLAFLEQARALMLALFPGADADGGGARFPFEVRLTGGRGIAHTRLMLGGEVVATDDNSGTSPVRVVWPGKDAAAGVEVQVELDSGQPVAPVRLPGPWGLLLLVDGTGCRDAASAICRMSKRCDPHCAWYKDDAELARRACGQQACYWGLNGAARAHMRGGTLRLSVPFARGIDTHVEFRSVGEPRPLVDPTLFDLSVPDRIVQAGEAGCAHD